MLTIRNVAPPDHQAIDGLNRLAFGGEEEAVLVGVSGMVRYAAAFGIAGIEARAF